MGEELPTNSETGITLGGEALFATGFPLSLRRGGGSLRNRILAPYIHQGGIYRVDTSLYTPGRHIQGVTYPYTPGRHIQGVTYPHIHQGGIYRVYIGTYTPGRHMQGVHRRIYTREAYNQGV